LRRGNGAVRSTSEMGGRRRRERAQRAKRATFDRATETAAVVHGFPSSDGGDEPTKAALSCFSTRARREGENETEPRLQQLKSW
jgi:hypothetical protein